MKAVAKERHLLDQIDAEMEGKSEEEESKGRPVLMGHTGLPRVKGGLVKEKRSGCR